VQLNLEQDAETAIAQFHARNLTVAFGRLDLHSGAIAPEVVI